jgi:FkbM family methyltransferase
MLVLFGAGSAGRYALKYLREQGEHDSIVAFADNNEELWNEYVEIVGWKDNERSHVPIYSPREANRLHPDATWVACAISRPAAVEIRAEMKSMGVQEKPLYECIPVHHGLPPANIRDTLFPAMGDVESQLFFNDQISFRKNPDYDYQMSPSPMSELYFPDFIKKLDNEHLLDAGACDGDTVKSFLAHWDKYSYITALEPDEQNFAKLSTLCKRIPGLSCFPMAVSDTTCMMSFTAAGDASSHIDGNGTEAVECIRIDDLVRDLDSPPTYIKFDIEGFEPKALWGSQNTIREHSPVLAVCAYHESEHLWSIPLLIHALNPSYHLYFRRYAEGAFEIIWYAVPEDRIIS